MRTFIAVDLDREIKENLSSLIDGLRKAGGNVRWVKHQGMHLTLKFMGEVEKETITGIEKIIEKAAQGYSPFPLTLRGTGCFPHERNPRVLWVGIESGDSLLSIQKELDGELEKTGFPRETREFRPHLTLGRVKTPAFIHETVRELNKSREKNFGEMMVRKISFFQSVLQPAGAEYTVLSEHHLK